MRQSATMFVMVSIALGVNTCTRDTAVARPQYKSRFDQATKDSKAANLIQAEKCNVCHFVSDKRKRNDFGKALNKHIDKAAFNALKANKANLDKRIDEAIKAALKEKSPEGKTFGDLIEAGHLPAQILD